MCTYQVGTNARNGTERNCSLKHGTVAELCKFDQDGQKHAARVKGSVYCHQTVRLVVLRIQEFSGWLRGPY